MTTRSRIVLVDDEPLFVEFVEKAIVAKFDAEVKSFEDPFKAWRELEQTDPDLLITGAIMPGLTGEEIVRRLMGRQVTYPILVVSGWSPTEQWVRECAQTFPDITFLGKPFTMEQLYTTISQHL